MSTRANDDRSKIIVAVIKGAFEERVGFLVAPNVKHLVECNQDITRFCVDN